MKHWIPNALTALNLVLGMLSILQALQGNFITASLLVVGAMVADGLDGRVARFFKVSSDFGKELDSLCDLVSFGVAPAVLSYLFYLKDFAIIGQLAAVAFAVCGALRLARFNVNTTVVKGYFMGLPIPAAGCVVATFILLGFKPEGYWFPLFVLLFAYLMVSTVHYPDFKGKGERVKIVPLVLSVLLGLGILFFNYQAFLFAFFLAYAFLGMINTLFNSFNSSVN